MFETAFRWLFGDPRKSRGIRLRNISPLDVELDEDTADGLGDVPMIRYRGGIVAWFRSDDEIFPEDGPQRSITEIDPVGDLDEQIREHLQPNRR